MNHFSLFRIVLVVLVFSNLVVFAQNGVHLLEAEKPVVKELAGGETHIYKVPLSAGQFLHVVADQHGIDVMVTLFASDGRKLLEVDSPNGSQGVEPLWFVSEAAGNYRLEVSSLNKNAKAGRYEISIKELRPAVTDDNFLVAGKKAIAEGVSFEGERKKESVAKAIEKYEEAAGLFRQIESKKTKAPLIHQIGKIFNSLNNNEKAILYYNEAYDLFEDAGLRRDAAGTLFDIGISYENLSLNTNALESYKRALAIGIAIGDKKRQAEAYNYLGIIYSNSGDFKQGLKNFQQALKLSEETEYKEKLIGALTNIGNIYQLTGNFAKALEFQQRCLSLLEEWGISKKIPSTLLNIGNIYNSQGNYGQALFYYQKALTGFEAMRSPVGTSYALNNIGTIYLYRGQYAEALNYFEKARQMKTKFLAKDLTSLLNIGLVYRYQGKFAEAIDNFQKSLVLSQELGETASIAENMENIAGVYYSQGNFTKSLEFAENAAKFAEENGYFNTYWNAQTTIAKMRLASGQKKEAKQALESAINTIEILRKQVAGGEQEEQNFFEDKTSPYYLMVELLISQDNASEAFSYAERAKSRTLLDVLQSGKIKFNKTMTAQEQEQEQRFKNELVSLNAQISKENGRKQPDKTRLADLQNQLEKKRLEFEDFQTRLYAAHPELKVQRGEMKPISLEEAGKLLPDNQSALLEYVVTDDKAFLFVLTKDAKQPAVSLKVYSIDIKQKDLAQKTESFRLKLAKGDLDFPQSAQDLYNLLLKPAEAQIKNKTNLIIVPDASLWDLPFQALQPAQNRYLIETSAVSYAPSLTALREMTKKNQLKQTSSANLLAFGNPIVGKETSERIKQVFMSEKLSPLPEAERLVNSLKQMYGAGRSKIYIGADAKEETAKTESSKYRILQFSAHGILNDVNPMYSHIVLSQSKDTDKEDGLLEAWEMKDLNLNADMVILSACETARGRFGSGEGVIGMSWALFIAGAPTTVVSQWKVESSSTTELMLEFHRQLLTGKGISKAEALRRASLKLLKNNQYKHPSYWAAFVIVGDGF